MPYYDATAPKYNFRIIWSLKHCFKFMLATRAS